MTILQLLKRIISPIKKDIPTKDHTDLSLKMYDFIQKERNKKTGDIVIVCIGTDRSTGDSLGPFIGTFLNEMGLKNIIVYGTLENPIHGQNLDVELEKILEKHPEALIIAIDAAMGSKKNIGRLLFCDSPLFPGSALGKKLTSVGSCTIKGVIGERLNVYHGDPTLTLEAISTTRLSLVINLANKCSAAIKLLDERITLNNSESSKNNNKLIEEIQTDDLLLEA